ncbi:hypothetical protein N866_03855 [Actinotalea ferrariae CF5-4]|uniref:Integrase n=1 Tax=Actinotalea ferrariae CF5-4 TaxID=948458 RepID=A0A021VPE5_9CELL|nr:hypothetical protein [Actinotalea ferrariae]EYR62988.1 hypothetical protein N866_03855 [Actinotalea ferrariae CF5-4]
METPEAVSRYVAQYRSSLVLGGDWSLAEGPLKTLVMAAGPMSRREAHDLCAAVSTFLAGPCGWDRTAAPDFRGLLNERAIAQCAAGQGSGAGSGRVLAALRAAQRAAFGISVQRRPGTGRRHTSPIRKVGRVYDACAGLSVATFALVLEGATGRVVTESRLRGLVASLLATVSTQDAGTVVLEPTVLAAYLQAVDTDLSEELVQTRATSKTKPKPKRPSERQAQARLKADRAAHRRATQGATLADDPSADDLLPQVREAISRYRPQDLDDEQWEPLRSLVQRLVVGYKPPSEVSARNAATIVVAFLVWVWSLPERKNPAMPPTAEELLRSPLHEAYVQRTLSDGTPAASAATERSVLRRCLRSLEADPLHHVVRHTPVAAPYSPEECAAYAELALAQPTDVKTRNACYLIGLTLGAGLSPEDLRSIRLCDLCERTGSDGLPYLEVSVRGRSPRTVPVRTQYEPLVRRAMALSEGMDPEALVIGRKADRHNATDAVRRQFVTASGTVDVDARRLRTTWLFAVMNTAVPLPTVLRLAGLRSARTLVDLLPLCPAPSELEVRGALAAVRTVEDASLPEAGR